MTPVAAPADKRFRRVRVNPARKQRWRGLWSRATVRAVMVLAVAAFGVYHATDFVLSAEALTVSRITINGNVRLSRGEVLSLLDGLHGRNMLTVDLEDWQERLLASPWVANAAMRRVLPGTVDVFVAERQPMGIGRIAASLYLIDQRGDVIDEFGPNYADLDLPIIDGLAAGPPENGLLIDEARATLAGRLLASLQTRPELARRLSQVDVSDPYDAVLILKEDTALVRVGDDQFAERVQSYLDLAPALRERIPDIDYVDMRFDERVYVKPQGRAARPQRSRTGGNR